MPRLATRRLLKARALTTAVLITGTLLASLTSASAATDGVPTSPSNLPAGIEALQPYVGQEVCDPVAKTGVRAFSNLLLDTYPDTTSLGIVRDCGVGGQSEHKEGRAWDWGASVDNAHQKAEVDALLAWLLRTDSSSRKASAARRFGIMYMIWNKRIWKAYDTDKGWQPYAGADEHTGHVHFSFGWNGAKKATSWWTGAVAPVDYGPHGPKPVKPVRDPANLLLLASYQATVLKQGTSDAAATKVVQRALAIVVDGVFGSDTTAAVKAFQTNQKLTVDGIVDTDVWQALFPKPQTPFGKLEATTFGIPGTVALTGWAADADTVDPIKAHLYVDGKLFTGVTAGGSRPDVERLFPGMGPELGFTAALALADGVHTVCAYAINTGPGSGNPSIGCKGVTVRHSPLGHVDALTLTPGSLLSRGWVLDPDTAAQVQVAHTVDGVRLSSVAAAGNRPDVGAHYPGYGDDHGYGTGVDLASVAAGTHVLCAVATNLEAGADTSLGCVTGIVRHDAFGRFDSLVQTPDGLVLSGWGIEPDVAGPATITGTLDGQAFPAVTASLVRSDVARVFPVDGAAHGFQATLPVPASDGNHTVCLSVANVGAGKADAARCRTIAVTHKPFGRYDVAAVTNGVLTVKGWALDPDTRGPVTVHVRVDGTLVGHVSATKTRPDVARAYPLYGAGHGFLYSPTAVLAKGTHNVCLYLINTGAGSGNPGLSCRKVTVA